jgi:hypothetical protein
MRTPIDREHIDKAGDDRTKGCITSQSSPVWQTYIQPYCTMLSSHRIVASIDRLHRLPDIVQAMLLNHRLHGYTEHAKFASHPTPLHKPYVP